MTSPRNRSLLALVLAVLLAAACSSTSTGSGGTSGGASGGSSSVPGTAPGTSVPDQSDAAPTTTTVFQSGESGYTAFRIPAVVTAADGTLLAFAEGRVASAGDAGNVDLALKRSTDAGRTWGALQVVGDDGDNFVGNPSPVLDRRTGKVVVLATHKNGADNELAINAGTGVDTSRVWLFTSDDGGATWPAPRDITAEAKLPTWRWNTVGPGHGIQLTTGAHPNRLVAAANHTDAQGAGDHVLVSDDGGTTWTVGARSGENQPAQAPDEQTAAALPDGTIVFSSRNQNQGAPWHRLRTTSTDGGQTYAAPFAEQIGLVVPVVQGSLLSSGPRLLFSSPSGATARVDLRVRASTDAGVTWSEGTLIVGGPAGYSDLVELPGQRVGDLYETGAASPIERIDFTVIGTKRIL